MNWINIDVSLLENQQVLASNNEDVGIWLRLTKYCCMQENGGRIEDAAGFDDTMVLMMVREPSLERLKKKSRLWAWEGDNLVVWGYPAEKEGEVQMKRITARENGKKGGRPKNRNVSGVGNQEKTNIGNQEETKEKPTVNLRQKRKGREGKGKEEEGEAARDPDLLNLVEQVLDARDDWKLNADHVGLEISKCPKTLRVEAVRQFVVDVANMCQPPDRPTGMLRRYMGNADKYSAPAEKGEGREDIDSRRFAHG